MPKMTFMLVAMPVKRARKVIEALPEDAVHWSGEIESERLDYLDYVKASAVIAGQEVWKQIRQRKLEAKPKEAA